MLEDAFARLEAQVQAVERAIVFLELVDDGQALQIVLEAAVLAHARVQCVLPGMAERRMAEIVRERNRFDEILVQAQVARHRTRDLRDFQAVRETGAEQVAFVIDEHLGLVFEPAERGRMNDAVAVALELGAGRRRLFGMTAPARLRRMSGIRSKMGFQRRQRRRLGRRRDGCAAGFDRFAAGCLAHVCSMSGAPGHPERRYRVVFASVANTASSGAGAISVSPNRFSRMNLIAPASAFLSTRIRSI